jgi:hypothetical protein
MTIEISISGDVATLTSENFDRDDCGISACDIRDEIAKVFADGSEAAVQVARCRYEGGQVGSLAYFPNAGRGAVATGGPSEWTDCDSIADLLRRYRDRSLWSN